MKWINRLLNGVTMYRLVVYYLVMLLGAAVAFSFIGWLPYDPFTLLFNIGFLLAVCAISNSVFAWAYRVPHNIESVYISALILALVLDPTRPSHDLIAIGWAGILAMASKYVLALKGKHIFNPVAIALVIVALVLDQTASWWVGSAPMLPIVLLGGILLVLKIRRGAMVLSFLLTSGLTILVFTLLNSSNLIFTLQNTVLSSPWLFFAFVFVTEPLTTPPTRRLQILYGMLVGFLFAPQIHIGAFYFTPELAIVIGNLFSYAVSPKTKLVLTLKEKIRLAPDIYDFIFVPKHRFAFAPGQYMEWTLGHDNVDSRGNRRYFTLASSPTEKELRIGVKFYRNSSSYKQSMLAMDANTSIIASQVAGDFVLPRDRAQKCVFIAGGIGITPFRSMIQYMLDTRQRRPVVLFYANKSYGEIVYQDVLDEAQREIGIKVVYSVTDTYRLPSNWQGRIGRISRQLIQSEVPDYIDCIFYISGPNEMVAACKDMLKRMDVPASQIKTDFFPGLT